MLYHSLPLVFLLMMQALCLLLLYGLGDLFSVSTQSLLEVLLTTGLKHIGKTAEQTGSCVESHILKTFLNTTEQRSSVLIAVVCRCFQPFYTGFQILRNTQSNAIDPSQLVFCIAVTLLCSQFKITDGCRNVCFQV